MGLPIFRGYFTPLVVLLPEMPIACMAGIYPDIATLAHHADWGPKPILKGIFQFGYGHIVVETDLPRKQVGDMLWIIVFRQPVDPAMIQRVEKLQFQERVLPVELPLDFLE